MLPWGIYHCHIAFPLLVPLPSSVFCFFLQSFQNDFYLQKILTQKLKVKYNLVLTSQGSTFLVYPG